MVGRDWRLWGDEILVEDLRFYTTLTGLEKKSSNDAVVVK